MPLLHPQARFDPIPPDLNLEALVERTANFHWVKRISAEQVRQIGQRELEKLVLVHVVQGGRPLVIEAWNDCLPSGLFSARWLEETYDKKQESVRDIGGQKDIPMTTGHYLRSLEQLTNQWNPSNFRDERRQRLYLKDIDCPPEWYDHLRKIMPPSLFYLNANIEQTEASSGDGVDGAAAPAGDLMSSLPRQMRAENLMCYIGHEGTYTPAHREMCASLGQNIMVEASGDDDGERAGSSVWFMTETKDREVVREFFLSMLGHDIEIEKHFAQINAWKKATFPVYIVDQRVGDFILVPPLAPHQVWNRGTRTTKVAWNRTTVETLEMALSEALPKSRLVCRDEQYKNKAIIYFTLQRYCRQLEDVAGHGRSPLVQQMARDVEKLLAMLADVLVDEMFACEEPDVEYVEFDSNVTCSYCRANIFNRFLTCKHCVRELCEGGQDTYDVCMDCYAMGRSCLCMSRLRWCEQWKWPELVGRYEAWRTLVAAPMSLEKVRKKRGRRSIAEVCQVQLRQRPWHDVTKADEQAELEPLSDEAEAASPSKKRKKTQKDGKMHRCHVCSRKDHVYKLAFCTAPRCREAYCYGVLYRAFELMPQTVMRDERWKCPKCLKICSCAACRRQKHGNPYLPRTTLLGHDTRHVADDRSIEALVDFRSNNLVWLRAAGDEGRNVQSKRMRRLQQAADAEKAKHDQSVTSMSPAAVIDGIMSSQSVSDATSPTDMFEAMDAEHESVEEQQSSWADSDLGEQRDAPHADSSSYPDPSMLGPDMMIGMAYYDQDDSPDRILFDPYNTPRAADETRDDWAMIEPSPTTLRAARRQANRAAPQDLGSPTLHGSPRKRARSANGSQLSNHLNPEADLTMDPALFDGDAHVIHGTSNQDMELVPCLGKKEHRQEVGVVEERNMQSDGEPKDVIEVLPLVRQSPTLALKKHLTLQTGKSRIGTRRTQPSTTLRRVVPKRGTRA